MKSKDYVQELNGLTTDKLLDREKGTEGTIV